MSNWLTTFDWFLIDLIHQTHHDASSFFTQLFGTLSKFDSRNFGEKNEQRGFHFIFRSKILWSKLPHKRVAPENEMIAGNPYNNWKTSKQKYKKAGWNLLFKKKICCFCVTPSNMTSGLSYLTKTMEQTATAAAYIDDFSRSNCC